jgi:hypothetical protein
MRATLGVRLALGALAAMTLASCGVPQAADNGGSSAQQGGAGAPPAPPAAKAPERPKRAVEILELTSGRSGQVPFEGDVVTLPGPDGVGERRVPVTLWATEYWCRYALTDRAGRRERDVHLLCYELRGLPYPWAMWSWEHEPWGRMPNLLTDGPGANYLAWVRMHTLSFANVSAPRERNTALTELLSADPTTGPCPDVWIPVPSIVPTEDWSRGNAVWIYVQVRSIKHLDEENWEVQIASPDGSKVYTLVGQKGNWRLKK